MKFPFAINLNRVTGVFSRLNPMAMVAKLKGKNKDATDELDDDDDMFADLGNLDELDAAAKARQNGEDEDEVEDTEIADDGDDDEATNFADLDAEDDAGLSLENLDSMPDFEDDFEDDEVEDEDAEEAEAAATKKKLLMLAGGGIAIAIFIGAASWLVLSGDGEEVAREDTSSEEGGEIIDLAATHDVVISLDNIPMASPETPAEPAQASAPTPETSVVKATPTAADTLANAAAPQGDSLSQLGLVGEQEPGVGVVVPAGTKASFATIAHAPKGEALEVAPVDILVEQTDVGILPRVGEDGQTAFTAYARPAPQMDAAKPKIAVIVTGLGMSRGATEAALSIMPQNVTLSLDVYARGLDFWVARAREDGHEILLSMPLDSANFPFNDPGPEALRVLAAPEENVQKLEYILSRTTGYFGVLADHGGKFLSVEEQIDGIMNQLKGRGLMYVDGGVAGSLGTRSAYKANIPWAGVEMNLDQAQSRAQLNRMLQDVITLAEKRSMTVVRVSATPLSMEMLSAWIGTLDQKGFQLVPVSALAKKQLIR